VPSLQAYARREYRRVRRQRALLRVAMTTIFGGAIAAAALWVRPPSRGPQFDGKSAVRSAASGLTVLDGTLLVESRGGARTLHAGDCVGLAEVGALEASSDRPVHVRLSDVVALTLAPSSRIRPVATGGGLVGEVAPALEVIALERGRVHLQVKKLDDTHRFHVVTPDADVEVRGTVFDVALRRSAAPRTCVSVDEGLVLVTSGLESRLVSRGQKWGCDPILSQTPTPTASTRASPPGPARDPASKTSAKRSRIGARSLAPETQVDASDLAVQNRLFQLALAAERAGRLDDAARSYRRVLTRAPHGPLAAQARANLAAVASQQR
jgi:hypothetical protein